MNTLWEKGLGRYIVCLMKEEIAPGYPNNLSEHLATVQKKYQTGYVISRFLACAQENGRTYDFYKTYIEIMWFSLYGFYTTYVMINWNGKIDGLNALFSAMCSVMEKELIEKTEKDW